jgi:hypothetical protein
VCELNLKEKQTAYIRVEEEKAEAERKRLQKIENDKAEAERLAVIEKAEKALRDYEKSEPDSKEVEQKKQEIDTLYQTPLVIKAVKVEAAPVKADMRTFKKIYYAEITDITLIPREYLMPDMQMLNSIAKEQKEGMNIPGVMAKFR